MRKELIIFRVKHFSNILLHTAGLGSIKEAIQQHFEVDQSLFLWFMVNVSKTTYLNFTINIKIPGPKFEFGSELA